MSDRFWRIALLAVLIVVAASIAMRLPNTTQLLVAMLDFGSTLQPPIMAALTIAILLPLVGLIRERVNA